jgi:hypothetical protein
MVCTQKNMPHHKYCFVKINSAKIIKILNNHNNRIYLDEHFKHIIHNLNYYFYYKT